MQYVRCSRTVPDGARFCPFCGKRQISAPAPQRRTRRRPKGSGTVYKSPGHRSRPWGAYAADRTPIGYYATSTEAVAALDAFNAKKLSARSATRTFADIYSAWSALHFQTIGPSGRSSYEAAYDKARPLWNRRMSDLKTEDYQEIIETLKTAGLSRSMCEKQRQLFSQLCKYAMQQDIRTAEQEKHLSWIEILALAACRTGGKCPLSAVKKAAKDLEGDVSPEEAAGELGKYYAYYYEAYSAALGGLVGSYAIFKDGQWVPQYGLKTFSPIAAGYGYSHCDDFGVGRSFGFKRKHLGNDLMGGLGTPIVAVEGGIVEAMGWNRYGGWRVGIRSFDGKRYYYYAHLQKDRPFASGLEIGDQVDAGQLIGFMGRSGYSDKENVNNIEVVHLHFGLELVFDESQKECNSEIWIDVYQLVRLLSAHRSSYQKTDRGWERVYPYKDLDWTEFPA